MVILGFRYSQKKNLDILSSIFSKIDLRGRKTTIKIRLKYYFLRLNYQQATNDRKMDVKKVNLIFYVILSSFFLGYEIVNLNNLTSLHTNQ